MSAATDDSQAVLHWYDFICPFCYLGQQRNAILRRRGFRVVALASQAHPNIPIGGIPVGPRDGPMYVSLEREAKEAGLPLHWPARLPNTRTALAAAECGAGGPLGWRGLAARFAARTRQRNLVGRVIDDGLCIGVRARARRSEGWRPEIGYQAQSGYQD